MAEKTKKRKPTLEEIARKAARAVKDTDMRQSAYWIILEHLRRKEAERG